MKLLRPNNEAGIALVAVIIILALTMALAVTLTTSVVMDTGLRGAFARMTSGFYAAESGVNNGMGFYRNIFLNFRVPGGSDFDPRVLTLGDRTVTYSLAEVPGNPRNVTIPAGQLYGGINAIRYVYTVRSAAVSKGDTEAIVGAQFDADYIPLFQFIAFYQNDLEIEPGPTMHLHGRVHTNGNLYLNSAETLYIEDRQGAGVPASDAITTVQVSAGGDIFRGRKDTSACAGGVTVDALQDVAAPSPDLDPMDLSCAGGATRKVPAAELAPWKGSLLANVHPLAVPPPDVIDKAGVFWTRADLRIVLRLNTADKLGGGPVLPHTIEVEDAAGNRDAGQTGRLQKFMGDVAWNQANSSTPGTMPIFYTDVPTGGGLCMCTNANAMGCNNGARACYNPPFSSDGRVYATVMGPALGNLDNDYRRGGFYNWREKKWVYLLNINMHDLLLWNQTAGSQQLFDPADVSDGGLVIYASVVGPDGALMNNYGVRLFGSANLPFPLPLGGDPTGLTFVTDQAAYIAGDYNRGPVAAGDLPKQPAAVIADSVNVLSRRYFTTDTAYTCGAAFANDCQSNRSLADASRLGANTIINAAFLASVDTTTTGNYNGGLENYPRFHEAWGGLTLTYRGSFVSLGTPQHVNGPWCGTGSGCNIYDPPLRNWDYDAAFNDVRNLPPLTPRVVSVEQVLFSQDLR